MFNQNLGDVRIPNSPHTSATHESPVSLVKLGTRRTLRNEPRTARDPRCSTVPSFHFIFFFSLSNSNSTTKLKSKLQQGDLPQTPNTQASIDINPYGKHLLKTPSPTSQQKSRTEDNMSRSTPSNSLPRPRMVHSSNNDASHHQDKSSSRSRSNISTSGQSNSAMKGVKDIDVLCG